MKCDGERPIKKVRDSLARYHGGQVVLESPAKGESQSNGVVEQAGQLVEEFVVVWKEHIEAKTGISIATQDNIVSWIARWAAMGSSRYLVGKDWRTPYERRKGRRCRLPIAALGEKVWYRPLAGKKGKKKQAETK